MCSAAWTFSEGGYEFGFNRDEKWTRPASRDPQFESHHPVPGACARDAEAGGTWLFANEYGVTLAVMNAYPRGTIPSPGKFSRGMLPLLASAHATADRIEEALFKDTGWSHFAPCDLLLIDQGGLRHFGWDGESFGSLPAPAANFLTTSSVATESVKIARHSRFGRISTLGVPAVLDDFTANDPAAAIFVTRNDGGTVSQTFVSVGARSIHFASRRRAEPLLEIRFPPAVMKVSRRWMVSTYLILLALSWIRMSHRDVPLPAGTEWQEIGVPGNHGMLRYRKFPGRDPQLAPLVLVHGSPMASSCFDPLLEKLPRNRTILVPDLPGFGVSSVGFKDYSFAGHAAALEELLDRENHKTAHWVAYSQGGGPVLELSGTRPDAFLSLTLLSSIGVQEYELTGDYFLNHVLHGAQWIALEGLRWGIPHFGLLDRVMLNTRYAENFFTGDLRPLRGRLEKFVPPVLIIHGNADGLVMPASAREHFRIVPQSTLTWLQGGHMVLMSQAQAVAAPLAGFIEQAESGTAATRDTAEPPRKENAARSFDPTTIMALRGTALWLTLLGIALATFASEDLACLTAGLLVARGLIPLPAGILASFAGIWLGDMALYAAGRYGGGWFVRRAPLRWVMNERSLDRGRDFLLRRGGAAIFMSRFTPGMRLPLYVAAGIVKLPGWKLACWFFLAGIAWTVPVVSAAAYFGQRATDWILRTGAAVFPAALMLILATWLLIRICGPLTTHPGRRILRSKLLRAIRWEFWPPLVFYPPVVVAAILIGLRRRNLLAFTAVNPAIPHGGISGESKAEILNHLMKSGCVASFVSLPAGSVDKLETVRRHLPDFPLVVKPDVGERGAGVVIVHNESELVREIESRKPDTIVQSYVEGAEFGVFYIRHPHETQGRIFSITTKIMTEVMGDGEKTLDELILDDERAYLSQRHFRRIYQDQLGRIPAAGERVILAELGSHCRGALFLDGNQLITPVLEVEIDRIARTFAGFFFGRFDLRCPGEEALKRGEGIRLIELNGVTSEATHIYHPHTPLRVAYRTLISQWRQAYDIGIANAAAGAKVSTWKEFAVILKNHFTRSSH